MGWVQNAWTELGKRAKEYEEKEAKSAAKEQSPVYSQGVSIEHGSANAARPSVWKSIANEAINALNAARAQQPTVLPAKTGKELTPFDNSRWMYQGSNSGDDLTWRKLRVRDKDTGQDSYVEIGYKDLFAPGKTNANALNYINGIRFYDDGKMNEYLDKDSIDNAIRSHFDLDATRYTIYDTDKKWMNDTVGGPYGNGALTGGNAYDAILFDTDDEKAKSNKTYAGRFDPRIFSRWSTPRRKEGLDEDLSRNTNQDLMKNTLLGAQRLMSPGAVEGAFNGTLFANGATEYEQSLNPYDELSRSNISLQHSDKELKELAKYKNDILDLAAAYVFEPSYEKRKKIYADFEKAHGIDGDNAYNEYNQKKILSDVVSMFNDDNDSANFGAEERKGRAEWMLKNMDEYLRLLRFNV